MILARRALLPALILLIPTVQFAAPAGGEEPLFPILQSGVGAALVDERRIPIEFSTTAAGTLVALTPLVSRLGGKLEVGPLGESHTLTLGSASFIFGPAGAAMTEGERIIHLPQPPIRGAVGLQVPLELLRLTYGNFQGFEFEWRAGERLLEVRRLPPRELAVDLDAVNLQGVTTLVFQFPSRPRYEIERSGRVIDVRMTGDRLRSRTSSQPRADGLVRAIDIRPEGIRIELEAGAVAKDYVLASPYRLVFDVFRGAAGVPEAAPVPPPRSPRKGGLHTIVIDPGHGGADTGAKGPSGSMEKNLTLILARTLKRQLEARLPVKVALTRQGDVELPLDTRSALANQYKADLFISVHLNSSVASGAKGAETYFLSLEASDERAAQAAELENQSVARDDADGDPLFDLQLILWDLAQSHHLAESQRIARMIQEELNLTLELRNRGVKQAPFRVLMGAAMPAVLVELGFLTNPDEEERLNAPEYRSKLVETLVRAIARYRSTLGAREIASDEAIR